MVTKVPLGREFNLFFSPMFPILKKKDGPSHTRSSSLPSSRVVYGPRFRLKGS